MTSLCIVQTSRPRVIERNKSLTDALISLGFELSRRRGNEGSYIMAQYDLCDEKEGKAVWLADIESFVFGSELFSRNWEVVSVD